MGIPPHLREGVSVECAVLARTAEGSPFAARAMFVDKDARTLAREIFAMDQAEHAAAFKGSTMKRAKLRGLKRNASVVLGNVGTHEDGPVLEAALVHDEPFVRELAAWALTQIGRLVRSR